MIFELRYKLSKTYFISGFIFPNKLADFLENKFSDELISNYRDDLDFQHVVDLVQTVNSNYIRYSIAELFEFNHLSELCYLWMIYCFIVGI